MTTTIRTEEDAAQAIVGLLPGTAPLTIVLAASESWTGQVSGAVVASFVGSTSADVAIVFPDALQMVVDAKGEGPMLTIVDVLRPALEAATARLGVGVLDDARLDGATTIFDHPDTSVFGITDGARTLGWFAIRLRASAAPSSPGGDLYASKLGRITNVEMSLTVEIGRTRMSVRDVLALEPGGVIELDRAAGAPADVLLNGRLIAHGEVVVVDQDYAVRITRILDVAEGLG